MRKPQWLRDVRRLVQFARISAIDRWRFVAHSSVFFQKCSAPALESKLTILAHKIEKGLALPEPTPGFGQGVLFEILDAHELLERCSPQSSVLEFSLGVIRAYKDSRHMSSVSLETASRLRGFIENRQEQSSAGGLVSCSRNKIMESIPDGIDQFFGSRRSVRDFSDAPVVRAEIISAARLAQRSPSVCNRQPWRMYVVDSEEEKKSVLSFQNGNRGFGHSAGAVVVVTVPLSAFHNPRERNQAFVDGGMFSMSLIWGLHARGLGSCALNWCATPDSDNGVRGVLDVPKQEVIIMMIAVGHLKEEFDVAESPRRSIDELVRAVTN